MGPTLAAALSGLVLVQSGPADIQRGHALAGRQCARCHAIGPAGSSPFKPAPPFRELHLRYPVENLAESLAEGILTDHPAMPEFRFDPSDVAALIAYLKSLEAPPRRDGAR